MMAEASLDFTKEKRELTSDFNEGKLQIYRLNNSWERFQNKLREGLLTESNWELDDICGELSKDAENRDLNLEETQKYSYKIKKINELVAKYKYSPEKLYLILRMKEKILRRLQDAAGKGSKRSEADEDDIDT